MEPIDERKSALLEWIKSHSEWQDATLQPMIQDASARRYFRVLTKANSYVAMDAPPHEDCRPFIAIAKALRAQKLYAPDIFAENIGQGYLLIEDFGDFTYLKTLNEQNADTLYRRALNSLSVLQSCSQISDWTIPPFTRDWMWREWYWFCEWFLNKFLRLSLNDQQQKELEKEFTLIVETAVNQPQVFMHRDFHSANLMVLNSDVGILDFQDAFIGPITYDLVSLLRDCYIAWPKEKVIDWVFFYREKLQNLSALKNVSDIEFMRWFDLMGLERHLKALFTFSRKYVRDQTPRYLKYIPTTLSYLIEVSANYQELQALHDYLRVNVKPVCDEVILSCVQ